MVVIWLGWGCCAAFAQYRGQSDQSFREFPAEQVLGPHELKALLDRVQLERAQARVANMLPQELADALRNEMIGNLSEETRKKIARIARDVTNRRGVPRNSEETAAVIEEVRDRLRTEMPEVWNELSVATERNREVTRRIGDMISDGNRGNTTIRLGPSNPLTPDGANAVDKLLSDLLQRERNRRNGGPGAFDTGPQRLPNYLIEQLNRERQRSNQPRRDGRSNQNESSMSAGVPNRPRDDSGQRTAESSPEAPTMQQGTGRSMAERFNRMVEEVTERAAAGRDDGRTGRGSVGGLQPYLDRLSTSLQSSINDSVQRSVDRRSRRSADRGNGRSNSRGSLFSYRDMGQPTPPPAERGQIAVPLFLLVFLLLVLATLRFRKSIVEGVERFLPVGPREGRPEDLPIHGCDDIIQTLDRLVLCYYDEEAARWNHSEMQAALEVSQPGLRNDIQHLIAAYKTARYAPQKAVDAIQLDRAEHLLHRLVHMMSNLPSPMSNARELTT